jgi:serine/threonine-protein kinase
MLGDDLANHLGNFPVRARPDRWSYRVGRFIQRHQAGVALGAVALIAVLGLSIESLRQARRAERQADAAAQSADFVVGLLELSYPFDSGGNTPSMLAMLDSGAARVATLEQQGIAVPVSLYEVLALGYNGMARYDRAIALDSQALALRVAAGDPDTVLAGTRWQLAEDLRLGGHQRAAALEYRRIVPVVARYRGARSPRLAQLLQPLARAHRSMNELDTVDSLLDVVEGILAENPGKGRIALAHAHVTRGHVALERGDLDRAEAEYRAALELRRAIGASDLEVANSNGDLAGVARRRGNLALADSLIAWSVAVKRRNLGDMHPEVGDDLREFGAIALARRDYAAAEQNYRDALLRYENAGPVPQWRGAPALVGLATALARRGEVRQADSLLALVIPSLEELETSPSSLQLAARQLRASLKSPSS